MNRLTTLTPPTAFTATGTFGFGYDVLNRRTSLTRPNTVNTTYGYDNLSRLLSVAHKLGATTLDGASYTVDNAGNRSTKTDLRAAVTSNYTYDPVYELTQTTQGASTTEAYSYDPVGNRLTSLGVSSYTNNSSNELTAKTGTSYTYDNNGNMLTSTTGTNTTTYTWDYENRLSTVTLPGSGGTVSFKYDPFGRRIYKSSSIGISIFAYDGDNLAEETSSSGAIVARYLQGLNIDEPLAQLRSSTTTYYEADGLGSITSLSNTTGALAQTYTFDSFGKQTASSGSLTNPFRYTSRESDAETGLYFYRARYYDQSSGRFLSEDPIRLAAGVDFYQYVGNNPTIFLDHWGLQQQAPRSQGPPVYNPGGWNDGHQYSNNCYSYACNLMYPPADPHDPGTWSKPQPGDLSGRPFSQLLCKDIKAAANRDGLKYACNGDCPPGYHRVRLYIGSNTHDPARPGPGTPDYHWYREDTNGSWSSKHGLGAVGPQVTDPDKDARAWGYNVFCGTMCSSN